MINGQRDGESVQPRRVGAAEQQLLKYVERISDLCARDRMTPDEMVACLFDELAARDLAVDIYLAADIAGFVPHNARARFVEHVRTILQPGFRRQPFAYGGGRLATEDELRADAEEQTARVCGWAAQFRLVMDTDSGGPGNGQG
jgi:hypothetical protein